MGSEVVYVVYADPNCTCTIVIVTMEGLRPEHAKDTHETKGPPTQKTRSKQLAGLYCGGIHKQGDFIVVVHNSVHGAPNVLQWQRSVVHSVGDGRMERRTFATADAPISSHPNAGRKAHMDEA